MVIREKRMGQGAKSIGHGAMLRKQTSDDSNQTTPVKFATLVFFEEFNGASRVQRSKVGGQKIRS
jgi:hypothetical protein